MAILVHRDTRVLCQGLTGRAGRFHTAQCLEYGTQMVGGVTPGKGGSVVDGLPVFDTVREAMQMGPVDATMIFVPAAGAAEAILEAEEAGVPLIIAITEGIPVRDMLTVKRVMQSSKTSRLIGPNCPGIITPGECKIGIMPGYIHTPGYVGIVSRSGTLTYEAVWQTTHLKMGQSTCVGIGGDPLNGTNFVDILKLFHEDPKTECILLIGEIGGSAEEEAASWITQHGTKPIAAYIAGVSAPPGRRMGHAGAIVSGLSGSAETKIQALKAAGVLVAETPALLGETMLQAYRKKSR